MKIAAYVHWRRTCGGVTGVGRHMRAMVMGLSRAPGVEVTVLGSKHEMPAPDAPAGDPAGDTPFNSLPKVRLPFSRAMMERVWWATGLPKAERYVPDADWVYCPADAYVPTRKIPFASSIHDIEVFEDDLPWLMRYPHLKSRRRMWRLRLGKIFKHARLIATSSEFSKRRMVEVLGARPEQIVVVSNGVDPLFLKAASGSLIDDQAEQWRQKYGPYVVTVGGLNERKGAGYLLDVADHLRERKSDLKILVSGRNDEAYKARQEATGNVIPLGYVPDAELPGLLKGAQAMLFLSRYEGFGIPIVEAMACSTPVVTSNFASVPEAAGDAGLIVDVNKPAEIAGQVMEIARDPGRRSAMIERGLLRVREFTWDACVARLLSAMKQAGS